MMLIIQIAAGIVLGVAILVYHKNLFAIGKALGVLVLVAIFIGLLIWGATEATNAVAPHSGKIFEGLRTFGGGIFSIICGLAGAYGLWLLLSVICRFNSDKLSDTRFWLMCGANVIIVLLVGWGLTAFTPFGTFADGVERWSRDAGYKDFGSMLILSFGLLWTYIPLSLIAWSRALKQRKMPTDAQPE